MPSTTALDISEPPRGQSAATSALPTQSPHNQAVLKPPTGKTQESAHPSSSKPFSPARMRPAQGGYPLLPSQGDSLCPSG